MEAVRKIIRAESDEVTVTLPKDLVKRLVEIIIIPLDSPQAGELDFTDFLAEPIQIPDFVMPPRGKRNAR